MRLALLSTIAALSGLGIAEPNAPELIAGFNSLTTKFQALLFPTSQLSALNAPLMLIGAGPWAVRTPPPPQRLELQRY